MNNDFTSKHVDSISIKVGFSNKHGGTWMMMMTTTMMMMTMMTMMMMMLVVAAAVMVMCVERPRNGIIGGFMLIRATHGLRILALEPMSRIKSQTISSATNMVRFG